MTLPDSIVAALEAAGTLVTPSPQRAVALREAWARHQLARGRRVWATPDVLHFDAWIERGLAMAPESGLRVPRLLSPVEQQLAWRSAAASLVDEEGAALLGLARLADALRRADALVRNHAIDDARLAGDGGAEARWLRRARQLLQQRLTRLDARLGWQSELAAWQACGAQARSAYLVGFDTLLPAQQRFAAVADGAVTRGQPLDLAVTVPTLPQVEAASDSLEELQRIAAWCRQRLSADPQARLLVVLPDLDNRRELLERALLDELDPGSLAAAPAAADLIAIEGGRALSQLPRIAMALERLARLVEPLEREDWLRWLRSPEIGAASDATRIRLERTLLSWQGEAPTLPLLLSIATQGAASDPLPAWLGRYRTALALVQAPTATSGQWSRNFDQALRELDPDPQPLDSAAWQTHQRWQQLLEEFAAAQTLLGNLGARDALRQLRSLAQRTRFAPAAPSAPVLVTAATADPIIHYDGIWVGGLHEAVFPQSSRADPFLPRALQREFGVVANDPDALLQRARRELAAWQRCSGELRLSFAQLDDGTEQAISPLLRSWPIAPPATRPTGARGNASGWLRQQVGDSAALEARDDSTGLAVAEGEALSGGTGLLASYNQCAFRGYAELRLKARGWDEPRSGVDPLERGQIIHSVLQALWSTWRNGAALAALDDAARRRAIEAALHDVLARHPLGQAGALATRAVEREARRALRLVDELCALEAQRPAFAIAALESRRPLRLGPAVLDLQIDRVDALASGAQVVLDYKTGRGVPTDWNGERPDTIQLIAYRAALAPAPVEALCYAQLSESQVGFRGLSADAAALAPALPVPRRTKRTKAWEQRSADWDRHLAWLGARIAAGAAVVEPRASACRYCDLALLCRRAEQAGSPDDDDDGGAAAGVDEAAAEAAGSDA